MRPLAVSLLTFSLVATGPLSAMAFEQAPPAAPRATLVRVDDDFTSKRQEYQERAQRQMDEWGQKINRAAESAKENGKRMTEDAQAELDKAWAETREQWAKLQQASADGWERTRTAYERASHKMREEWNKFYPEND
jgi:hypothetical protein